MTRKDYLKETDYGEKVKQNFKMKSIKKSNDSAKHSKSISRDFIMNSSLL